MAPVLKAGLLEPGFEPISKHWVCCLHCLSCLQDPPGPQPPPKAEPAFLAVGSPAAP